MATRTFKNVFEAIRANGENEFQPAIPQEPTGALPGSKAKIALLRRRLERGEHLWHPADPIARDYWNGHRLPF